jgi:hypothetical protein
MPCMHKIESKTVEEIMKLHLKKTALPGKGH